MYSTANERGLTSQAPFCLPCGKLQARRHLEDRNQTLPPYSRTLKMR
ncbi:MAG: hypothetical protein LBP59_19645 [Planctomycetaceae bacterium]|nr:hypothetical protein [Planctomycetaceae bacterium]